MTWRQRVLHTLSTRMAIVGMVSMLAVFAAGFGFLFSRPVRGSGTGSIGQCPAVLFVAATGSAEYASSATDLGASAELQNVFESMATTDGGANVGLNVLLYQPNSLDVVTDSLGGLNFDIRKALIPGYLHVMEAETLNALYYSVPVYLDSEQEGVSELWTLFNVTRITCNTQNTKFVLAGYSQGAMVVHDFLNQLATSNDRRAQASILGAVLLGDPDRVKHAGVTEFGTASSDSSGICRVAQVLSLPSCTATGGPLDIAPLFQSRTVSVCMYDDPVCDTSDFAPDLAHNYIVTLGDVGSFVNLAKAIHGSYSYVQPAKLAGELMGRFIAASA